MLSAKSQTIKPFLEFYFKAKTIYNIHSPTLFDFADRCLRDQRYFYAFDEIEYLRQRLKYNKQLVKLRDFGAGSKKSKGNQRTISDISKQSASTKDKGALLFKSVLWLKAQTVLELGTNLGIGSLYLAKANKAAHITTIEGDPTLCKLAKAHFQNQNIQNIKLINGNFDEVLATTLSNMSSIDLAFLDGNHKKEATIKYYNSILPKLSAQSIVFIDDIRWSKEMYSAWKEILSFKKHCFSIDLCNFGLLIFNDHKEQPLDIAYIKLKYKPWKLGIFG